MKKAIPAEPKGDYSKSRFINHPHYRNVEVRLFSDTTYINGEEVDGYTAESLHECNTGHRWMTIKNGGFCFSWEEAVNSARELVANFTCDDVT